MRTLPFEIVLPFSNDWEAMESLRTGVRECLRAVFPDETYCDGVAMTVRELLENAVKYGKWDVEEDVREARVSLRGDDERLTIEVVHATEAGACTDALFEVLKAIAAAPSPEEAYVQRIQLAATRTDGGTGGLGLARISYEADCRLRASLEGKWLRVVAESRPRAWVFAHGAPAANPS